ncbi:hypothetical protein HQ545_02130 [Candidatus Woesearchaeota archaeon]|nr:hypothetical protein [Candidatus Woesearchaeota archaeon]
MLLVVCAGSFVVDWIVGGTGVKVLVLLEEGLQQPVLTYHIPSSETFINHTEFLSV